MGLKPKHAQNSKSKGSFPYIQIVVFYEVYANMGVYVVFTLSFFKHLSELELCKEISATTVTTFNPIHQYLPPTLPVFFFFIVALIGNPMQDASDILCKRHPMQESNTPE